MRSSTKSESNENNGNGSPSDNINNNSNDAEKLTTASVSQNATTTADVKAASKKSPTTSTARNHHATEGVAGDVIDISSTSPTECNSTFINQPAPTDNDSTIQKVEPVENSEKKVNVYEQVSAALHKSIRDRSHGMSLH